MIFFCRRSGGWGRMVWKVSDRAIKGGMPGICDPDV